MAKHVAKYQRVADLGHVYELLVCRGAHVEADGKQFLQARYNQRGLNGITVPAPLLFSPLNIWASTL